MELSNTSSREYSGIDSPDRVQNHQYINQQPYNQYPSNAQYQYQPNTQYAPNTQYQYQPNNQYPPPNQYPVGNLDSSNPYDGDMMDVDPSLAKPIDPTDPLAHLQDGLSGQARKAFIMKVYIILVMQLLITVGMCFISYYVQGFLAFQINNQWLMWVCFSFAIVTQIVIFCCPAGRRHPINLIMLLIFTLSESYSISYLCSYVSYYNNSSQVVVVAAVMTFAMVLGLTLYAIFTRTDFTIMWGIIIVIFVAMLMLGIFSIFVWSPFLHNLYCSLGVIVFGIYLVIDTQMVVGGKRLQLSMDDYVVGALILYIDIIQIFLYMLELFGRR